MTRAGAKLYFLAGVTSSGKTSLALDWAEENGAEILSCDSIALYRGMDIGSAKPTKTEQARVVHHGLDLANVDERYDVSKYLKYAKGIIEDAYLRNSKILVVGGSGFYLRSFFSAVIDDVFVSDEIKDSVKKIFQEYGSEGLLEKLNRLNAMRLGKLDQANPVRLIKSLERCMATGLNLSELQEKFRKKPTPYLDYKKKTCLLDRNNCELEQLIEERTKSMLSEGLIEEVAGLIEKGLLKNHPASTAVGYRETLAYMRNEIKRENLAEAINVSTRQLVSKQRKWFRKYYSPDQILIPLLGKSLDISDLNWSSET